MGLEKSNTVKSKDSFGKALTSNTEPNETQKINIDQVKSIGQAQPSNESGGYTVPNYQLQTLNAIWMGSGLKHVGSVESESSKTKNETTTIFSSSFSRKFDCHAFLVHCKKHDKILVSKTDEGVWMPYTPTQANRSWDESALDGFLSFLSKGTPDIFQEIAPFDKMSSMQVFRIQLPQTQRFITRLTYYFSVIETQHFKCCQQISPQLEWMNLKEVKAGIINNLRGPELVEFCNYISGNITQKIEEYSLEEAFLYVPRDPPRNLEEDMLKSLRITEKDIERLYADFLEHCFPSFYQTFDSFKLYMSKYEFEKDETRFLKLFRAIAFKKKGYISFHEFLLGLACMEPTIQHGEFRVKFIFRFYDADDNGHLSENELKELLSDMGCKKEDLNNKLKESLNNIAHTKINNQIEVPASSFISAVGAHAFRGTSVLCRSPKPIFNQISKALVAKAIYMPNQNQRLRSIIPDNSKSNKGPCPTCKEKRYEIASHLVRFYPDGRHESVAIQQVTEVNKRPNLLQYSMEVVFNNKSAANQTIQLIRDFNTHKGTSKQPKGLLQEAPESLWILLLELYQQIDKILDTEFKCQKIYPPCYVMGDLHGNLEDLLSLEKTIWKQVPCLGANYLFLGDYVDRGQWGFECALYLIAFKILCPNKVTMLRGNHEVRELQVHYSYKKECALKYGEVLGLKIWELTNKIFDKLPVSAVIDDAIFCAHGGICRSAQTIDQIRKVKRELRDPEAESALAWEILWSDPCHMQQFIEIAEILDQDVDELKGFVKNTKRGTAFLFNEIGLTGFLRNNGLSHVIRAHEVPPLGYKFHFINKCATIFSCSHYCGNDNDSACILVSDKRLRVMQIDTVNNAPATD